MCDIFLSSHHWFACKLEDFPCTQRISNGSFIGHPSFTPLRNTGVVVSASHPEGRWSLVPRMQGHLGLCQRPVGEQGKSSYVVVISYV